MSRGAVSKRQIATTLSRAKVERFVTKVVTRTLGRHHAARFSQTWLPRAALVATIACDCGDVQARWNVPRTPPPPHTLHLTRPSHPASLPGNAARDDCWTAPPADNDGYAPLRATTGAVVQEVRALAGRATTAEAVGVARASIPAAAVSAEDDEAEVAVVQVKSAAVGGARRETCKHDAAACRTPVGTSLSVERPRSAEQIAALSDAFLPNLDGGECHAVTRHSLGLPPHAPAPCAGHALLAACGEEETEAGVCLFLPLAPPRSAAPPPADGRNGTNRSPNLLAAHHVNPHLTPRVPHIYRHESLERDDDQCERDGRRRRRQRRRRPVRWGLSAGRLR